MSTVAEPAATAQAGEVVDHEKSNRISMFEERMTIFYRCQFGHDREALGGRSDQYSAKAAWTPGYTDWFFFDNDLLAHQNEEHQIPRR